MIKITVQTDTKGLDSGRLQAGIIRGLYAGGLVITDAAKHLAPVDTGELRRSITLKAEGNSVIIGTDKEYAPFIEFGSGPHISDVQKEEFIANLTAWAHRHGIEDPWPLIQAIRKRGTTAKPFLRPAVEENKEAIAKAIRDHISQVLGGGNREPV